MPLFIPGHPRLRLLDTDKVTVIRTLYLPPPDRENGVGLEWIKRQETKELYNGAESTRVKGYIPELKLSWKYYNDVMKLSSYDFGALDGCIATLPVLLGLLDFPPGRLVISPGPAAGGFTVETTKVGPMGITGTSGIATGVQVTFRAGKIFPNKILETF